jgi:hypothetical protein
MAGIDAVAEAGEADTVAGADWAMHGNATNAAAKIKGLKRLASMGRNLRKFFGASNELTARVTT